MTNTPKHLQPFSIVSDADLARFRKLEIIAIAHIEHILKDPSVVGINRLGADFTREELEALLKP